VRRKVSGIINPNGIHKETIMKIRILLVAALSLIVVATSLQAQGTAFTYQGRLNDGANPASGIYDLRFTIYDSTNNPGVVIAGPLTNSATGVTNGLFTVTLDFGAVIFPGADRWLEISARTNGGGAFTTLTPRQPITPTPYALHSLNSAQAVSVAAGAVNSTALADGAVTAAKLAPGAVSQLGASDGSPTNAVQVNAKRPRRHRHQRSASRSAHRQQRPEYQSAAFVPGA
jgi:hypothetical protein